MFGHRDTGKSVLVRDLGLILGLEPGLELGLELGLEIEHAIGSSDVSPFSASPLSTDSPKKDFRFLHDSRKLNKNSSCSSSRGV